MPNTKQQISTVKMTMKMFFFVCAGLFCLADTAQSQELAKSTIEAEQGDFYGPDSNYGVVLTSPNGTTYRIKVSDDGSLVTYNQQAFSPVVEAQTGDFYAPDSRYGIVLTTSDSTCYRIKVLNDGTAVTEKLNCPGQVFEPGELSVRDYLINPNFTKADLPSQEMRDRYDDWWAAYNAPRTYRNVTYTRGGNQYSDPPLLSISLDFDTDARGMYSMGRGFGLFIYSMVDFLRTTGDPAVLEEIFFWATEMKKQFKDWDGRGYPYCKFMHIGNAEAFANHYDDDMVFLDEQLIFGYSSMMSWALHKNRHLDSKYGELADHWFSYWDEVYVPKWLYRTTVEGSFGGAVYTPPAALGLANAVNWDGPAKADDKQDQWSPFRPPNSGTDGIGWHTPEHPLMYPTRDYGHPLALSIVGHYNLGRYLLDTNKTPKGTWGAMTGQGSGQEHLDEAHRRLVYWNKGTGDGTGGPQADGSRTYWMQTSNSTERMRVDSYAPHVNNAMHYMFWEDHPLVQEEHMKSYALMYYDQNANPLDIVFYAIDDNISGTGSHKLCSSWFSDGRRQNSSRGSWAVRTTGYISLWDESGKLEQLLDKAVGDDPTRHIIGNGRPWNVPAGTPTCSQNTNQVEQNHMSAQMSLAACRAGLCN